MGEPTGLPIHEMPTDRQLIIDMQQGDRVAMEQFFRRYSPYLFAVCLRYVSDGELAKDLLHDSFVRILTSIGSFTINPHQNDAEVTRSIKSWSARIAANLALNHLRDQGWVSVTTLRCEDPSIHDIPDSEVDAESLSIEEITSLIEDLPPNYRTVFNLFAIEGFSHREISQMLGISESLSATQYHRAKSLLKQKISKHINS